MILFLPPGPHHHSPRSALFQFQPHPFWPCGATRGEPVFTSLLLQEYSPLLELLSPRAPPQPRPPQTEICHQIHSHGVQPSHWPISVPLHRGRRGTSLGTALTTERGNKQGEMAGGWTQEADHHGLKPHFFPFQGESHRTSRFSSLTLSFFVCTMSKSF